ncbi:MAG: GntR family transcriptional regulator [Candidatus Geothermincolia bacterium]
MAKSEPGTSTAIIEKLSIDESSFTPAYVQLTQIIHDLILGGELRAGERIPSENELCAAFSLSRMTVRKAISELVARGMLRSVRGKGTFVVNPSTDGGLFFIPDFHEMMREQGAGADVKLLGVRLVAAGKVPAEKLEIRKGKRALYLERVLQEDGEPLIFDRKYVRYDLKQPLLEAELGHGSTDELFKGNAEMAPVRAQLELSVTVLDRREAELLDCRAGDPAFCMEQHIYAANELKVAWGWLLYRGDRFSFKSLSRRL